MDIEARVAKLASDVSGSVARTVRALPGGISNRTYLVRLVPSPGRASEIIVRILEDRDRAAQEAEALRALGPTSVLAPRLLARRRVPSEGWALVCSPVPGRPTAHPQDPRWLDAFAATLAAIHEVPRRRNRLPVDPGAARPWLDGEPPRELGPLHDLLWPAIGRRRAELGVGPHVLVHGDFHAGNVHWVRGRVAGVIDWEMARWGPAAADVAYAYMDLLLAAGHPSADAFLDRYVSRLGMPPGFDAWLLVAGSRPLPDPARWLPSYLLAGYEELTPALLRRRLGQLVRRLVAAPVAL